MKVLLITDIHSNFEALSAVLSSAAGRYEEVWCLGDVVGYGPEPRKALQRVRDLQPVIVAGNHDRGATGKLDLREFSSGAADALERHRTQLTPGDRQWLDALPLVLSRESFTLCHGSLTDPVWGYILSARDAVQTMNTAKTRVVLTGHTHVTAVWHRDDSGEVSLLPVAYGEEMSLRDGSFVLNPGSLGQPRDGNPAARYAILDTTRRSIVFEREKYPVKRVMKKMRAQGYPASSVERYGLGR